MSCAHNVPPIASRDGWETKGLSEFIKQEFASALSAKFPDKPPFLNRFLINLSRNSVDARIEITLQT